VTPPPWRAARAAVLALLVLACRAEPLPEYGTVPAFSLVERSGRPVGLADLRGRPWVADFIFTRCAGICPAMTARMARLRGEVPAGVRLVSFTVDPVHDTPAVLSEYARRAGAGETWLFVTGAQKDLHALSVGGFKLAAEELPAGEAGPDGPFLHSSKFVLVDARAVIRGYYDSSDAAAMERLARDARRLAEEAS
jgi:protein SCO1/2